ncbi:MAG: phosphoglucomutase, alpha-D-glucose phosphate-specific [Halothiobacillus sp. 14-56-357]|jgi:phosphoglucomutase|uniref:phosphoglucomutase (alpha-D-glucose-1,6-bisphosphate-dependent) n=1 Tax=Halothiobacillus sp. 15-55-196 TaxID=1970382 RepID=UPI000BC552B3|nr:phosphoglucomutase (alpha-D-glucose-1,6-bisphosphate-dependent) [Halothiobacillus sp. 15-55-196]OZB37347.1 MAG: phosphoglucomutase, alpha-D-glucose phosphate-specific [Halothiobacillus sp. 15-55-196]OZB56275.1 MAG: phosphoglucomutase, alpha-D-glucose phosphate-specific [Halothiobacillus sp. 14-56-357]OZB78691.1 MAG: phosphoglucomutase, alpha-D-glucose phosphate-specific [Halothiobacillus sp. 13-55-115]
MSSSSLAGSPPTADMLVQIPELISAYYTQTPDSRVVRQQVSFGTSGHRGTSLNTSFNEAHIAAITAALIEYRREQGITGAILIGADTHALSWPAFVTTVEVLAAAGVPLRYQAGFKPTPTPVISRLIIVNNAVFSGALCDGIVITPSHNPPSDGGFKYNPTHGGPADTDATGWIQNRANELLDQWEDIPRMGFAEALTQPFVIADDFVTPYVSELAKVIDFETIRKVGVSIGVDPMGGAGLPYWKPIAERYQLDLTVVNELIEPDFRFMPLDHDGKIRMDCSSPYAMSGLLAIKDRFDIAFGNDTDADRHGIVTPDGGLMNPNHYLAVAIDYLFRHRPEWAEHLAIGKTVVSSSMIDRVAAGLGRTVFETPVGIKWFQPGLTAGELGFGGEESAGATFLCRDGQVWTTDKDGLILGLLAAEILAVTGKDPWEYYNDLVDRYGQPFYTRVDAPISAEEKSRFKGLTADSVSATNLAGESITRVLTHAPGNQAPLGGLKVETANGWFAARPSGTEDIYKIYAESFISSEHLAQILNEAKTLVSEVLAGH